MNSLPVASVVVGPRSRKELGDIPALSASMAEVGLLQPIVVSSDNRLIAGQRRLEAAKSLGWETIPTYVAESLTDAVQCLKAEMAENTCRKDFTPSEAVHASERIVEALKTKAAERQRAGKSADGQAGGRGRNKPSGKLPEGKGHSEERRTRTQAAEAFGMKARTFDKAAAVVEAAEAEPEKYGKLVEQMDRTGKVDGAYKQLKKLEKAEDIQTEPPPLPQGPFRVIVADPPWSYDSRAEDATHRAANPYQSMTIDDIRAMPIASLAHEDSILWLWTTNAHMREAFTVLDAWGFKHKTILTWEKDRMGTGDWLRGQTEHCLMAVRGKPTILLTNQTTVLRGPLREHSRKPDEFYAMVEVLCPGSKVELFSRNAREGWASHGNETELFSTESGVPEGTYF